MSEKLKKICGKYWPPGKEQLLILVLLGLLLAVIAVPAEEKKKETEEMEPAEEPQPAAADSDYESCLEQRLEALLGQVEGVGAVQVLLTFEGSGEKRVEKDAVVSGEESREETVYEERSGSERTPYVTSESNPRVEGVLVIAQGGGSSRIRQEILEAAQALFGVDAHKIKIMKMEGTK